MKNNNLIFDTQERMKQVGKIFSNILEQHMFIFTDEVDRNSDVGGMGEDYAHIGMSFDGDIKGFFNLLVPISVCVEITANLMGLDVTDEKAQSGSADGAKEMLNIIGANVLSDILGPSNHFDITHPSFVFLGQNKALINELASQKDVMILSADGKPIFIQMKINDE